MVSKTQATNDATPDDVDDDRRRELYGMTRAHGTIPRISIALDKTKGRRLLADRAREVFEAREPHGLMIACFGYETRLVIWSQLEARAVYCEIKEMLEPPLESTDPNVIQTLNRVERELLKAIHERQDRIDDDFTIDEPVTADDPLLEQCRENYTDPTKPLAGEWEPGTAALRDGETRDDQSHAERNAAILRELESELETDGGEELPATYLRIDGYAPEDLGANVMHELADNVFAKLRAQYGLEPTGVVPIVNETHDPRIAADGGRDDQDVDGPDDPEVVTDGGREDPIDELRDVVDDLERYRDVAFKRADREESETHAEAQRAKASAYDMIRFEIESRVLNQADDVDGGA